ncbi:MAG TPA: hypothetical protein PLH43_09455, partial [Acetivibrio sp.]|uniref:hypothetical protein n=1 Tax=Acetivibrio sp. TaxID=1872092 RepID=UPI002B7DDB2A
MAQYDVILTQNVAESGSEYVERFIPFTKGIIISANSLNQPVVLAPGTNGYFLKRDDTQECGLAWVPVPAPVDSPLLDWDSNNNYYNAYASGNKANGRFYYGNIDPTGTQRLNYDGYFYATALYSGNLPVLAGTGTEKQIAYWSGTSSLTGNNYFIYDNGNVKLSEGNILLLTKGKVYGFSSSDTGFYEDSYGNIILKLNSDSYFKWNSDGFHVDHIEELTLSHGVVFNNSVLIGSDATTTGVQFLYPEPRLRLVNNVAGVTDLMPGVTDSSSAVAYYFGTINSLTTQGAKLAAFYNSGNERFYIDKDGYIGTPDGIQRHFKISAGNAIGGSGTDAGDLILKAGDAINGDSNSNYGTIYLIPGSPYNNYGANLYLGHDTLFNGSYITLRTAGTASDVSMSIIPKGSGTILLQSSSTISVYAENYLSLNNFLRLYTSPKIVQFYGCDGIIAGADDNVGFDLTVRGGSSAQNNIAGGDVYIYGGNPGTGGIRGNIYFGDGSNGYLPAKTNETNVVYYDQSTGKLSYGSVSGGGMVYPGAGIAVSTGSAWGTSLQLSTTGDRWGVLPFV